MFIVKSDADLLKKFRIPRRNLPIGLQNCLFELTKLTQTSR